MILIHIFLLLTNRLRGKSSICRNIDTKLADITTNPGPLSGNVRSVHFLTIANSAEQLSEQKKLHGELFLLIVWTQRLIRTLTTLVTPKMMSLELIQETIIYFWQRLENGGRNQPNETPPQKQRAKRFWEAPTSVQVQWLQPNQEKLIMMSYKLVLLLVYVLI